MSKRNDCHRPGAITPSAYTYEESYDLGGMSEPPFNLDAVRALETTARESGHAVYGALGKCGICGATFRYGDLWQHTPSADLVHIGQDCAAKYSLLAQRPGFDAHLEAVKRNRAARIEHERRAMRREAFGAKHPGLLDALALDHAILADMAARLGQYGELSEKQIAFAFKLAEEVRNPPPAKPAELHVAAPVSDKRVTVRGVVVGLKMYEGSYGATLKMTVKVTTPEGTWLAWGTCPSALDCERGDEVEFTAKLKAGREAHFALFARPTGAANLTKPGPRCCWDGADKCPLHMPRAE